MPNISVEYGVPAAMRDGVVLRADIYRPIGKGPWPVLLTRLPYGKTLPAMLAVIDPLFFARNGFIVVVQDTRGRFESEGDFKPLTYEENDGVDTVRWAASVDGSDGSVVMYGMSYFGNTQWMAAVAAPEELKAIAPAFTWSEPNDGLLARGGAAEYGLGLPWSLTQGIDTVLRRHSTDPVSQGRALDALIHDIDRLNPHGYSDLTERPHPLITRHRVEDIGYGSADPERSRTCRVGGRHGDVEVPSLNIGGWYDVFSQGTLDNFVAMSSAGKAANLIMGPWTHLNQSGFVGEVNYGLAASSQLVGYRGSLNQLHLQWFQSQLASDESPHDSAHQQPLPPVLLFTTGLNEWRSEQSWPLARAEDTNFYLQPGREASFDGPPSVDWTDDYYFDPNNPVPTVGGSTLMTEDFPAGSLDQAEVEARSDVLVYTSAALSEDVEVTGRVRAHLHVSSAASSADWVVRICDVDPKGVSRNLTDGIVRCANTPDEFEEREIDMWSISHVFLAGHRIRVHVTSSSFPRWDCDVAGRPVNDAAAAEPVLNRVAHGGSRPSHLALPVVPAR